MAAPLRLSSLACACSAWASGSEDATIVLMIDRMPPSGVGAANAAWNLAYDAGYGAGPAVFGLLAGHIGYPAVFVLTSLIILTALPAGARERSRPRSR